MQGKVSPPEVATYSDPVSIDRAPGAELEDARKRGLRRPIVGQLVRFTIVGLSCTTIYALLYVALHPFVGAQSANFIAMLSAAILNTAANRAFTFGVRGRENRAVHHVQGVVIFGFGWGLTAFGLFLLHQIDRTPPRMTELAVLMAFNLIATATRFLLYRQMFRSAMPV